MKTSITAKREENCSHKNVEMKREMETNFFVGSRVERELDGLWFPGTITAKNNEGESYEIEYDEDQNREGEVNASELRLLDPTRKQNVSIKMELTAELQETLRKDSLLMQSMDDPKKSPTVVLHHQGESHAAAGYIINGLENNVATGNGLRGIRWLRGNSF